MVKIFKGIEISRKGCPRKLHGYIEAPLDNGRRVSQSTLMALEHMSKTGLEKTALRLDGIHQSLREAHEAAYHVGGASNVVVCKLSAELLITKLDGTTTRRFVVFSLRLPMCHTSQSVEDPINFNALKNLYKSTENLYAALKLLYDHGQNIANSDQHQHGHIPDYNPQTSSHDQYIRHTEQYLAAYLAHPAAAPILAERLRAIIRSNHPEASTAKIYNLNLHIHSNKACCAPCEYVLTGLMRLHIPTPLNGEPNCKISLIGNFTEYCKTHHDESITFLLPQKSQFKVLVTVTADSPDAHHQKKETPPYREGLIESADFSFINTKKGEFTHAVNTTLFAPSTKLKKETGLIEDLSIFTSGSKATPGSAETDRKIRRIREQEKTDLIDSIARLTFK